VYKNATFSMCRTWRYELRRIWDDRKPFVLFICLNPSTADETKNDPTVTRCIKYAERWGYGGMVMANIFAFRATKPKVMKAFHAPIGPENDRYLKQLHSMAGITICAWGNHGKFKNRGIEVYSFLRSPYCLKTTGSGHPGHPLYLRADARPTPFYFAGI